MSNIRWKVSILFASTILSIFFSSYLGSDRIIEGSGNQTYTQMRANASNASVSNKIRISNLANELETGNNETKLDATAKFGKFRKTAVSALIEKIETNNSSSEEANSYMLLAM